MQKYYVLSSFSRVQFFATLWTVALQAPLSMGLSRQKYWSGLPFPPPGNLPDPRIKPADLTSPALAGGLFITSITWEAPRWKSLSYVLLFATPLTGPPGSSVHGVLQTRILKWVAILFSRGSSWCKDWSRVSWIADGFFTIWTTTIAGGFFTIWATMEAQGAGSFNQKITNPASSLTVQWSRRPLSR